MNKYLLLRDNKQSGPYSVDELAKHGIKAYDLVWLEGKSAAWRYPSEIEELKPFAPVIEEQPFDRFYKKSEPKTFEPALKDNTRVKQQHTFRPEDIKKPETPSPNQDAPIVFNTASKKIHVSLPGGAKRLETPPATPVIKEEKVQEQEAIQFPEKGKISASSVQKQDSSLHSSSNDEKFTDQEENFVETYKNSKQKLSVAKRQPATEAPVSKLLFRSVAAACLLLGGALIGLIINYNGQQQKFQQLNQLVEEIKQQDNPGSAKTVKNTLPAETIDSKVAEEQPVTNSEQPVYKEDIQLPVTKKQRPAKPAKTIVDTASQTPVVPEIVPAASKNDEASQKMDRVASETAKKNLWQLVTVDHNNYKTGVFGGVSNLSIKLSNRSLFQLKQVEVEVLFLSPEKKTVNKHKVFFDNVAPGEQLSIEVPKSNRGVKVEHSIRKISTAEFEVAHAGM